MMRRATEPLSWNNRSQEPWNHNLHYHRVIVKFIPLDCRRALDVGCGQGALTRELRRSVPEVTGIDRDERSIALASAHRDAADIRYVRGDFLAAPFMPGSFDLVTSVASLHHMDAAAALRRMAEVLRPGGTLVVVGLARGASPADACVVLPAAVGNALHRAAGAWGRRGAAGAPTAPYTSPVIWPPPLSYRQTRSLAARVLPGVRYRRRLYWRYTLIWAKPGTDAG